MRTTKADLNHKIDYLNKLTEKEWFLSQAYGGYSVVRVVNARGGQTDLFGYQGHIKAKELALKLSAYCQGIEDAKSEQGAL